jgi:hypothetical protein
MRADISKNAPPIPDVHAIHPTGVAYSSLVAMTAAIAKKIAPAVPS